VEGARETKGALKKHKRKMGGGNEVDACHWRWTKCNGQRQARELMTKKKSEKNGNIKRHVLDSNAVVRTHSHRDNGVYYNRRVKKKVNIITMFTLRGRSYMHDESYVIGSLAETVVNGDYVCAKSM
jgi:hypothetical protein